MMSQPYPFSRSSRKTLLKKYGFALPAWAGLLLSSPAWAVIDAPVREAMQAIEARQASQAIDLLSPLEAARAGDPDFDLAFGIDS